MIMAQLGSRWSALPEALLTWVYSENQRRNAPLNRAAACCCRAWHKAAKGFTQALVTKVVCFVLLKENCFEALTG